MPKLGSAEDSRALRVLLLGDPGTGKTGSLASLIKAGYKLHICDFDNTLDALRNQINEECPEKIGNVDFMRFRDMKTATQTGPKIKGMPKAYVEFTKAMDKWEDGSKPETDWDDNHILVIDSLTNAGITAFDYAFPLAASSKTGNVDGRNAVFMAQTALDAIISTITHDKFRFHVIVITHIQWAEDGTGTPSTIGVKYNSLVGRYFPTILQAKLSGVPGKATHVIRTMPSHQLALRNPAASRLAAEYPLGIAMAEIFKTLTGKEPTQ